MMIIEFNPEVFTAERRRRGTVIGKIVSRQLMRAVLLTTLFQSLADQEHQSISHEVGRQIQLIDIDWRKQSHSISPSIDVVFHFLVRFFKSDRMFITLKQKQVADYYAPTSYACNCNERWVYSTGSRNSTARDKFSFALFHQLRRRDDPQASSAIPSQIRLVFGPVPLKFNVERPCPENCCLPSWVYIVLCRYFESSSSCCRRRPPAANNPIRAERSLRKDRFIWNRIYLRCGRQAIAFTSVTTFHSQKGADRHMFPSKVETTSQYD